MIYEKFLPYMGNNHNQVPPSKSFSCGGIRLASLIGSELDESVWNVLTQIFCIQYLRIYRPNDMEWTDGLGSGSCSIYLYNENDLIKDIYINPHKAYIVGLDVDEEGKRLPYGPDLDLNTRNFT